MFQTPQNLAKCLISADAEAYRGRYYSVRVADRTVGRIMLKLVSGGREVWLWSVTGPYLPAALQPSSGEAESLDEARAALKAKWVSWMLAAMRAGEGIWNGSGE